MSDASSSSTGLLNINEASVDELMSLPGIGRRRAEKIVAHRERQGPFHSAEELAEVQGIGQGLAGKVAEHVTFEDDDKPYQFFACLPGPFACCQSTVRCVQGSFGSCFGSGTEEALFFPDDEVKTGLSRLLELLRSARRQLDVAVFSISHKDLAAALLDAHRRGVTVRVLTDDMQAKQDNSLVPTLRRTLPVRMDDNEKMHMHHKFVVIDGATLLSGSLNWTHAAVERGNENLVVSQHPALCAEFTQEFRRLWQLFSEKSGPSTAPVGRFSGEVAVLFFPEPSMTNVQMILEELESARRSIEIAVFTLTLDLLVNALIKKHEAGLRVRIITDNRQAEVPGADAARLSKSGLEVRVDRSWYAMHHKFAVVDQKTIVNGSFNWTAQATKGNQEDAIIFRNYSTLASEFTAEFDRLWNSFQPYH
ncbi:unnamed protein product [Durusdinium trenchii]|uniref:Mitochondrial cardiolipin hydrolase n=1 Tax=Durusdinium trenchii TaxID=1381693 RepID=A0ABP0NSB0_9DINO